MYHQYTTKSRSKISHLTTKTCISGSNTTVGISRDIACTIRAYKTYVGAAEQNNMHAMTKTPTGSIYIELSCYMGRGETRSYLPGRTVAIETSIQSI